MEVPLRTRAFPLRSPHTQASTLLPSDINMRPVALGRRKRTLPLAVRLPCDWQRQATGRRHAATGICVRECVDMIGRGQIRLD